jgi:ABC-type bacteriocin/lantibiotic exporter with double-glycine peptidase domain
MRFPVVLQQSTSDCGPANIRAVARHHGVELRNETVRRICRNDRAGSSVAGLRRALEQLGFQAAVRTIDFDELERNQKTLLPAIAVLKSPASGLLHYVTVVKMTRTKVWLMDPAFGLSAWSAAELLARWYTLEHAADPEKLEAGNRDPQNVEEVRGALRELGLSAARAETLLTKMPLIHIDDRIRYVRALRDQKLLPGSDAASYVERLILHYEQFPIPDEYTTTHFVPNPDGSPRLMARGHLLITVRPGPDLGQHHEPSTHPLRRIAGLMAGERRLFGEVFLAALFVAFLGLTLPLFIQLLVDHLLVQRDAGVLPYFIGGFLLLQLCKEAFNFYRAWLLIRISQKLDLRLMIAYVSKLMRLRLRFFEARATGDITSRVQETMSIRQFVAGSALKIVFDLLFIAVALAVMFLYDARLAAIAALAIPAYFLIVRVYAPILRRSSRHQMEDWAGAMSLAIESVEGMKTIKLNASEPMILGRFDARLAKWSRSWFQQAKNSLFAGQPAALLTVVATSVVLYLGSNAVMAGRMSIGQLVAFQTMLLQLLGSLSGLVVANDEIQRAFATVDRLFEVLESKDEERDHELVLPDRELNGELALENVTFAYTSGAPVLKNVSFAIQPGEEVVIVGASGAGKSTLVGLLARLHDAEHGTIRIDGHDIRDYALANLRRQIAVVAQDTFLFGDTVYNNIAHAMSWATLDEVTAAARATLADDFIRDLPEKYQTVVGERGVGLSGGQLKRILLARALLMRPSVLILDEAYHGLDASLQALVKQNVREWMHGRTVINITHDLRHAREADRVILLQKGEILELGNHDTLMMRDGVYRRLYDDFSKVEHTRLHVAEALAEEPAEARA